MHVGAGADRMGADECGCRWRWVQMYWVQIQIGADVEGSVVEGA